MKLYFTVLKGHSFDGSFEGGIKFKYEWNGSSSLVLMDEIKRLYPRLSALTVFITDSYYTHFYWNKVNTISGFQLFANYLREGESAVPGRHCYVYVVQQPAVYNQTQVQMVKKTVEIYCAVIKGRTASGSYAHDGFMPFYWNTADSEDCIKKLKQVYPQLEPKTRIFVIDCDGETVIGCPQLIHDFACWIGTNYMEGERIKIYIEPNAHAGLDQ